MRIYYDRDGRYAGRSQGLSFTLAGMIFSVFLGLLMIFPLIWPLVVLQDGSGRDGALAWGAQGAWTLFLLACFLLLGRRAHRVARARKAAQAPSAPPMPGPGPRDWATPFPADQRREI